MAFAALMLAAPVANAQKVNESAFRSKIEKSNADIADAKKNGKASTWINRGKAFYEAAAEPTKNLFPNMDAPMLKLAVGEPKAVSAAEIGGQPCEAWEYPYFTVYIRNGKVATWKQTRQIVDNAVPQAIEAYNKAYEIDPKAGDKVKAGLKQVSDYCSMAGNAELDLGNSAAAADAYMQAFEAQSVPLTGRPTPCCSTMRVTCVRSTAPTTPNRSRSVPSTSTWRSTGVIPTRRAISIITSSIVITVRRTTIPLS